MKVTDAAVCFGASGVFLFGSALVPFLGPLFGILTPLPFLFYGSKLGIYEGLKISSLTLGLLALISYLAGSLQLIFLSVEFCCLGLIMSLLYSKRFTIGYTVSWGTLLVLLLGLTGLTVIGWSKNLTPLDLIQVHIRDSLGDAARIYRQMGVEEATSVEFQNHIQLVTNAVLKVYLGLLIIGTGFIVWCNIVVSKPLFRLAKLQYPDFGPLDRWHAPEHMVWGLIASGFSLFLPVGFIQFLATNVLIVILAVYLYHGLSILIYYMRKFRIPPWVRAGIYFLIIFQQVLLILLVMTGLFDQWIDFRRIHTRKVTS